ncbi:hypothetical protein [Desulfosarcina sp.]|uniref:hypothetical protein n=1 Tax=Desulfosarcina sp. TaxID=2027861 RepID=UPI003566620D
MKKHFVVPKMTKCAQPLDKVTMAFGGYGRNDCDKGKPGGRPGGKPGGKPGLPF